MAVNFLSLELLQLKRLFPYFLLLDKNLGIVEMADVFKDIAGECRGKSVFDHFYIDGYEKNNINAAVGGTVIIRDKLASKAITGKLEYLNAENLLLFAGEHCLSPKAEPLDFDSVLETMILGFIAVDALGKITYANTSFCKMSGYELSNIKGRPANLLFSNQFFSELNIQANQNNLTSDLYEFEFYDVDGAKKQWFASRTLCFNEEKENRGWTSIFFDISKHKIFEQELITAKIDAERTASDKEMFLANMSHEIRTPMNAIISMSNQLSKTTLSYQQDYFVQTIETASKNLLVIIDDILDLTKIDSGKLNLEHIGFSLSTVLDEVMQVIMHRAEKKGLEITFINNDQAIISPILMGDPHRITQVILNLMSNAIKFTEKGSVILMANVLEDYENYQKIKISVKDTGIGMDSEFIEHLFENFTQEHQSVSRKYGGTGLGMSISQKLLAQMGGEFDVKSIKNEGSNISFVIELEKGNLADVPSEAISEYNEELFLGRRILIVDDNEMNRLVASTILLNYGTQVMIAEGGESAIEMVASDDFDLVLMDVQMPEINGYDTTRIIRKNGYTGPIIALTASAVSGEKEKCLAAGMDDYITKPINEEIFISMIDGWLKKKAAVVTLPEIHQPLYNLDGLRVISKGREDFVTKMIQMFCDNIPATMDQLNSSFDSNDLSEVSKLAHKLKSNIDNLGIISLQRKIRDIESLCDDGASKSELIPLVNEVNGVIGEVVEALKLELLSRNY